ncbi:MAG: nucleotidyltransferase domain-containing protein [Promethearchaeota archaeon]
MKLKEVLLDVTKYLTDQEVPYAIIGGFAAIVWGRARTTFDIDIIVDQNQLNIKNFVEFLNSKGLMTSVYDIKAAFNEHSHSTILLRDEPLYRIDLKGAYTQDEWETIETAKPVTYSGQVIHFGSPESLIAFKLKYGSERDLEDALIIFIAQRANLDWKYLVSLCSRLGVNKQFQELQRKAKESEDP